jgi:hypothetical protein
MHLLPAQFLEPAFAFGHNSTPLTQFVLAFLDLTTAALKIAFGRLDALLATIQLALAGSNQVLATFPVVSQLSASISLKLNRGGSTAHFICKGRGRLTAGTPSQKK